MEPLILAEIAISSAQAAPQQPSAGEVFMQMASLMVIIFAIFYFVYQRPMQKERDNHTKMVRSLRKGDKVTTIGGIHGEVTEVKEGIIVMKSAGQTKLSVDQTAIKRKLNGD